MAILAPLKPFLDSGDRLTQAEFHRRYLERPDIRRAELIDGRVYVTSRTSFAFHDDQAAGMVAWLRLYAAIHPGVRSGGSATIFLAGDNEVQPDAFLFRSDSPSGARVNADGYIVGAPQLVVEVAASSASYDLHDKKEVYRRNGVLEYVVWRVFDDAIDWFRLQDRECPLAVPDAEGVIESANFPDLRLHIAATLAGDHAQMLAELDYSP